MKSSDSAVDRQEEKNPTAAAGLVRALAGEIVCETPLNRVARCLYETMEHLDPSPGDLLEWAALSDRDREFYQLTARRLLQLRKVDVLELLAHDAI
jgi:hypothetical protein